MHRRLPSRRNAPIGLLATVLLWACGEGSEPPADRAATTPPAEYVGSPSCAGCHDAEYAAWLESHHHQAMSAATSQTVAGDFADRQITFDHATTRFFRRGDENVVRTMGPDGEDADFPVRFTFGVHPLQQYLLELPGGRLQAFGIAWDTRAAEQGGQRWFHLYPDEPADPESVLHWTRDGQNWNYMCADCHSTNVRKGYDPTTHRYDTRFSEIDVGCEACHGPASSHVDWATGKGGERHLATLASQAEQLNACAPCHSRRSQLAEGFRPERNYLDHYLPALLDDGLYFSDGQILDEVYVYGSFLQSRMHARGVTCSHCHEPHSATTRIEGNGLCTQCHSPTTKNDFPTLRAARYDAVEHHHHPPGSQGARCVSCHMPTRTYMQVDDRRDHSFRLPRPDLTAALGVPNACNSCHADRSAEWASERINESFGGERRAHVAAVLQAARRADPGAERPLSALAEDPSQPAIVRATALSLMLGYHRGASAFALQKGLRDTDALVRLGALRGAERWPLERRWREARHLLDDPLLAVRLEATRVLAGALTTLEKEQRTRLAVGIAEFMDTWSLHADRAEVQTAIAGVLAASGDTHRAELALERALELNPQWVPGLINLADLYRAMGRDGEGQPLLKRALQTAPESPEVLLANGLWLVRQGRDPEALPLFARAAEASPDTSRYAYVYALALHSAGQTATALDVLDSALARRPADRQLLEAAGGIAQELGDAERLQRYKESR